MITKENYEIWMIDQMDGNLSHADEQALMQFLAEHPELNEDCSDLDSYTLTPNEDSFKDKLGLLKTEADAFEIPQADYEAITALESGIIKEGVTFKAYQKTVLKADTSIHLSGKNKLKRAVLLPFVTKLRLQQISIAASIILVIGFGVLPFITNTEQQNIVATTIVDTPQESEQKKISKDIKTTLDDMVNKTTVPQQQNTLVANNSVSQILPIITQNTQWNKMEAKGQVALSTRSINAYELGLNSIMPLIIKQQLNERELFAKLEQEQLQIESEALSRKANKMANRAKVINFLSGNETKIKKYINKEGQLIAYKVESEGGMSFIKKVKANNN